MLDAGEPEFYVENFDHPENYEDFSKTELAEAEVEAKSKDLKFAKRQQFGSKKPPKVTNR